MRLFGMAVVFLIAIPALQLKAQEQHDFVPRGIEGWRQKASSKTEFTLDHSMLVIASKLEGDNEDVRRVIAGVNGVSVHRYKFPEAWIYDSKILDSVKDEYRAAGWKQVMNREKNGSPGVTNVWVRLENNAISNIAVIVTKPNEVDFISVSGSISPVDLSHLGGHFGIPKIEGGVTVPNTAHP
jgi:hypothetical protein